MNYIFLDVDGVLNNQKHYSKQHRRYKARYFCEDMPFNPRSLRNLYKIVKKFDAKIILTSSWRHSDNALTVLKSRLAEYGLKIYGMTTDDPHHSRGMEILNYVHEHIEIEEFYADNEKHYLPADSNFIIIDDEVNDIKYHFGDYYIIKTDQRKGLTYLKTREAIYKLNLQKRIKRS